MGARLRRRASERRPVRIRMGRTSMGLGTGGIASGGMKPGRRNRREREGLAALNLASQIARKPNSYSCGRERTGSLAVAR